MATYTCLKYHLIFGTQYRRPLLLKPMRKELYAYIGGIIRDEGGILDSIGGIEDHIHILCGIPPRIAVSNMLRAIKASSSEWVNENRRTESEFRWQRGFAAFSVSKSKMPDVDCYVENQEEHHSRISFEDEYRNFLIRHGIVFLKTIPVGRRIQRISSVFSLRWRSALHYLTLDQSFGST